MCVHCKNAGLRFVLSLSLSGSDEGIYYTHLGAGPTPEKLRETLEERFSVKGNQLRMVEVCMALKVANL